jgi:hypothetical protein
MGGILLFLERRMGGKKTGIAKMPYRSLAADWVRF